MSSRGSIGGAGATAGDAFQDEVFAWAAMAMVAEAQLPPARMPPDPVGRVGAQAGYEVDDVAIETTADGLVLCQAKAGLRLEKRSDKPLAQAIDQVVAQYLQGVDGRPVGPGRDLLAIVTDTAASNPVRDHLRTAVSRTATQPPGTLLGHELTQGEDNALRVALTHIRRSWAARQDAGPSDEDLRALFRVMAIVVVDTADGGSRQAPALRGYVPPGAEQDAWDGLVTVGRETAKSREWRNRRELVTAARRHKVIIGPGPSTERDIAVLRAATRSNLAAFQASTMLPVSDGLHLPRHADEDLLHVPQDDAGVLVVGEAGSGKTGVLATFAAARVTAGHDLVMLRAADLAAGAVSGNTPTTLPLDQVLLDWTGAPPGTLVIDALDAARGSTARARLADLIQALAGSRWQVVASVRTFDLVHGPGLQAAFCGEPVSAESARRDPRLDGIRHLRVGDLTEAELEPLTASAAPAAAFLAAAPAGLRALLHNPFNLRLACELLTPGAPARGAARQRLAAARTQLDLLDAYWAYRVDGHDDRFAREGLLASIAEEMLRSRQLRVLAAPPTVEAGHSGALTGLLSDNVLAEENRPGPAARAVIVFSHHTLFDYASMRCVLSNPTDQQHLLRLLETDPALPLVARPSLDMLFDGMWQATPARDSYWQLALALAASPYPLASLAAAARITAAGPSADDLRPLAAACTSPDAGRRNAGYTYLAQITGAIAAPFTPDATIIKAAPALATLAANLSDTAAAGPVSWECLSAVVNLLRVLEQRWPLKGGRPGAPERARTVVNVLDACRTDPARFENIALAVSGHLQAAIAADTSQAGVVARLLDTAALTQWGGRFMARLVDALPGVARSDAGLARRVADAAWAFQDPRDEQTGLGSVLVPMTISRSQEASLGRSRLGEVFPELCRIDLATAAAIFASIADTGLRPAGHVQGADLWPLQLGSARGWLASFSADMDELEDDTGPAMAHALRDALAARGASGGEPGPVMELLVRTMHSASAWAALLALAADTVGQAAVMRPLLTNGSLLAHIESHEAAGMLLSALAASADDVLRAELESAIQAAGERATAAGRRQPERIVEELLGCLGSSDSTGGSSPPLTPRPRVVASWRSRYTLIDHLADNGVTVAGPLAAAIDALDEAIAMAGTQEPASEQRTATQPIGVLFLAAAEAGAADPAAPRLIRLFMTQTAASLASDAGTLPGTPLARRVTSILLQAAAADDAGRVMS